MAEELHTDLWHLTLQILDVQRRHRSHKTEDLKSLKTAWKLKPIGHLSNSRAVETI